MTPQEAQHILGLNKLPTHKADLDEAYKKAFRAAHARLSYAPSGSDRQPYLDVLRQIQEAHDLLSPMIGTHAPFAPTPAPTMHPSGGQTNQTPFGTSRPHTAPTPQPSFQQQPQSPPLSGAWMVRPQAQSTATGTRFAWHFPKLRSPKFPQINLGSILGCVLTVLRYAWNVTLMVLYILGTLLRLMGIALNWCVNTFVRIPPSVTAGTILALVLGVSIWGGILWWHDNRPSVRIITLQDSDTFIDGALLNNTPVPNTAIPSAGIHKIRCVSRLGPSHEFRVLLLPGKRYQINVNLETEEHSIHTLKHPE